MTSKNDNTYVTSRGISVEFLPIPFLLDKARQSVIFPDPPTYTIANVAGDIETHFHDETTLETDEDRLVWEAYVTTINEAEARLNEIIVRVILTRGIEVPMPENDDWVEEQRWLGIDVPDDSHARRLHYIQTEVIGRPDDLSQIMIGVGRVSGVNEEALAAAEDSFRAAMGRGEGPAAGKHQVAVESSERQEGLVA